MARRRPDTREATETLQEIQGVFDRLADWVSRNPVPAIAIVAAILFGSAGAGLYRWQQERSATSAASAVAEVQAGYRDALGAAPGSEESNAPGDPEEARRLRSEYARRFAEVADAHAGTAAAVSARLRAGALHEELGDLEQAVAAWRAAAEGAPEGTALEALARVHLARGLELQERWDEAAAEHERAGGIEAYPARAYALADAARCWANAGEPQRALAAFDRAETASASAELPVHVAARMRELRAGR